MSGSVNGFSSHTAGMSSGQIRNKTTQDWQRSLRKPDSLAKKNTGKQGKSLKIRPQAQTLSQSPKPIENPIISASHLTQTLKSETTQAVLHHEALLRSQILQIPITPLKITSAPKTEKQTDFVALEKDNEEVPSALPENDKHSEPVHIKSLSD